MTRRLSVRILILSISLWMIWATTLARSGSTLSPIVYTVRFSAPETHYAEVEVRIPAKGLSSVELFMPVWSPGFYRVEDYASHVEAMTARTPVGRSLQIEHPGKNRWQVKTNGAEDVIVFYRLLCNGRSVTTNSVGDDLAILNGAAAFMTLAEPIHRPHEVRIELPANWTGSISGLDSSRDGKPNHYLAVDYDNLVDSPIVAGNFKVHQFDVDGSRNYVVDAGAVGQWDGNLAARDLEKIVRENRRF